MAVYTPGARNPAKLTQNSFFYFLLLLLILCRFHIVYSSPTYLLVPSHLPLQPPENKTKFKRKAKNQTKQRNKTTTKSKNKTTTKKK
ncbi:hypothetical protein LEMLEM_LOCUS7277, partial [Lemmus lemmus]